MIRRSFTPFAWVVLLVLSPALAAFDGRGVYVRTPDGEEVGWYENSYAFVAGISDYTHGWDDLPSVPSEVESVAAVLEEHGFVVEKHLDLDADKLKKRFDQFVNEYGFGPDNRLLFFFAGHGHTRHNGDRGYVVPADAPDPSVDEIAFARKALSMQQVLTWARQIESKHAIFLFDSCFSGTLFKVRSNGETPRHITALVAQPVRQFITSGSAEETVPARSVFTPAFIDSIRFGLADLDGDGYVTGTELGLHLRSEVAAHSPQTPQFGAINDYELSRGDFSFLVTQPIGDAGRPELDVRTPNARLPIRFSGEHAFGAKKEAELVGEVLDGTPARVVGTFRLRSRSLFGIKAFALIRLLDAEDRTLQVVKARTWVDGLLGLQRKEHTLSFDEVLYDSVQPRVASVELEFVKEE